MICEFCGGETIKKKVRKLHWFQLKLYVVDDVEAEVWASPCLVESQLRRN